MDVSVLVGKGICAINVIKNTYSKRLRNERRKYNLSKQR